MSYPNYWLRENIKQSPKLWNDNTKLYELPNVAIESLANGKTRPGTVRERKPLGILAGVAQLPATQTTSAGTDRCACGLAGKLVKK